MDELHQAMREVAGEVWPEVGRAVFLQPPCHVDARVMLLGELDVRIRLVVAQQDVEARLALLDEIVLERQGLFFVRDCDVLNVAGFRKQAPGFGVGEFLFEKIAAYAVAKALGFSDVDHPARGVFIEIHAGRGGQRRCPFFELIPMWGESHYDSD